MGSTCPSTHLGFERHKIDLKGLQKWSYSSFENSTSQIRRMQMLWSQTLAILLLARCTAFDSEQSTSALEECYGAK